MLDRSGHESFIKFWNQIIFQNHYFLPICSQFAPFNILGAIPDVHQIVTKTSSVCQTGCLKNLYLPIVYPVFVPKSEIW